MRHTLAASKRGSQFGNACLRRTCAAYYPGETTKTVSFGADFVQIILLVNTQYSVLIDLMERKRHFARTFYFAERIIRFEIDFPEINR